MNKSLKFIKKVVDYSIYFFSYNFYNMTCKMQERKRRILQVVFLENSGESPQNIKEDIVYEKESFGTGYDSSHGNGTCSLRRQRTEHR